MDDSQACGGPPARCDETEKRGNGLRKGRKKGRQVPALKEQWRRCGRPV
jgi:hypothetical protein